MFHFNAISESLFLTASFGGSPKKFYSVSRSLKTGENYVASRTPKRQAEMLERRVFVEKAISNSKLFCLTGITSDCCTNSNKNPRLKNFMFTIK